MTTFQHIGTARHRADDYTMTLVLYGRQADGQSVSVTVRDLKAYGFVAGRCDGMFQQYIADLLQWWLSMKATERSSAKYKKENDTQKPAREVFRQWDTFWFDKCLVSPSEITWTETCGHNIRHVKDGPGPTVSRFETCRYDVWNGLLTIMKDMQAAHLKLTTFWRQMSNVADEMRQLPCLLHRKLELYETMFQPELVWMVDHQLPACSWMTVLDAAPTIDGGCTMNLTCGCDNVVPCDAPPIPMAPFRVLSYDIEAVPYIDPETGECKFPDPARDSITTIGVCAFDMVSATMVQTVFMLELKGQPTTTTLGQLSEKTDDYDPSITTVYSFFDEQEMLRAFAKHIRTYDPDIITGYNVLNFDNVYLIRRIQALCGCSDAYCDDCAEARTFSRVNRPSVLKKKYTHSKQRGGQESWEAWIEGRDWMDIYRVVIADHKLRSYKLDNVCLELLGTQKMHIAYEDIPKHQRTPDGREFLAQYCVKDAWLPCQIIVQRCKVVNAIQMAQVTGVLLTTILHRGQQIRTMVLMLRQVKERCRQNSTHPRWFLPDESGSKKPMADGFEGAVVITPKPGYYQTPVVTLDFASLYPSIMRAYNMCFSTLIPSYTEAERQQLTWSKETHLVKDVEDEQYPEVRPVRSFDYPEGGPFEYKLQKTDICFITAKKRVGILPEILQSLLNERTRVKKMRKQYGEKTMDYAVLDGRQLALKVCANSVYGFTGAGMGYLGEKRIASSVTRVGRGMANHTKFMCEEKYKDHGLEIVYGDSVIGSTPLLLRVNNKVVVRRIESLATEWSSYRDGKESCDLIHVESWTEEGWTTVERVIRHVCTKELVHVSTHTGNIVCTTDHSLVRASGEEIAPKNVSVGDELLHNCPENFPSEQHLWNVSFGRNASRVLYYTPSMARLMGMFVGDGSCGIYPNKAGQKCSWAINNANKTMLQEYRTIANDVFPEFNWKILPTLASSGVYTLVPQSKKYGNIRRLVSFWRSLCYNNKDEKKFDDCVLQSSHVHRQHFWQGLRDADGSQSTEFPEISQKGRQISLSMVLLFRSLGYPFVVVDTRTDKPNIFRMRARQKLRKTQGSVRKISIWKKKEEFVYDLTTRNHHFHAGVGTLIVHNTDSVFANIPKSMCDTNCSQEELITRVNQIGIEMGKYCTRAFLPPNDLEYEKFYYPILLKGKKRYAGHKFEPGLAPKLDVKGFECVRRDFAPIVSKTQKKILVMLCKEHDVPGAIAYAREIVMKLLQNQIPIEDLTMSKQLTRKPEDYKNPSPHTELAKRLIATQPAHIAPKPGDRIDYLIRPGYRGEKTFMRAVTPEDIQEGRATADTRWYLSNQLQKPLQRIFEMVMDNSDDIFQVSAVHQSQTMANPMMNAFVQRSVRTTPKRTAEHVITQQRKKTKRTMDIKLFFPQAPTGQ